MTLSEREAVSMTFVERRRKEAEELQRFVYVFAECRDSQETAVWFDFKARLFRCLLNGQPLAPMDAADKAKAQWMADIERRQKR